MAKVGVWCAILGTTITSVGCLLIGTAIVTSDE